MSGLSPPVQHSTPITTGGEGTINVGNLNAYSDNSKNDNSSHLYGNIYNANTHYYGATNSSKLPQDRLEDNVSKGAAHDSAARGPDTPKCYPETRTALQEEILSWIEDGGVSKILWLSGPAGAGKTAIVGSIADICHTRGWLAGSFFFSAFSGELDRRSKNYLIPTLAYHLMHLSIPGMRAAILASIEAAPSVFSKKLDYQVDVLILGPLRKLLQDSDPEGWPKVVLVDGIDECDINPTQSSTTEQAYQLRKGEVHQEILAALLRASSNPSFPFRIVIASRPERAIQEFFDPLLVSNNSIKHVFLDAKYSPEADIELYTKAMLMKIGRSYGLPEDWYAKVVPEDWPSHLSRDVPKYLAAEASEQFVYAATAMRYVQDTTNTPQEQLKHVLLWWRSDSTRPFAKLDALYTGILRTCPRPALAAQWIRAVKYIEDQYDNIHWGEYPAWCVRALLESEQGETVQLLGSSVSLFGIADANGQPKFSFYHKSLLDFLCDPNRAGDLFVQEGVIRRFVSARCCNILQDRETRVAIPPNHTMSEFESVFSRALPNIISCHRQARYNPTDVYRWFGQLNRDDFETSVIRMYLNIHMNCHWSHCFSACKVWRKTLVELCRTNGWRVPSLMDRFLGKFKHIPYFAYDTGREYIHPESPFRPPPPRSMPSRLPGSMD